jgi:hypothetical protein
MISLDGLLSFGLKHCFLFFDVDLLFLNIPFALLSPVFTDFFLLKAKN